MKPSILAPLLLSGLLAACDAPPRAMPAPANTVVRTLVVGAGGDGGGREYSGEVRARYEIPLAFRIPGKIVERAVDVGARVRPGQLLARLDPADVQLQATQAQSQHALAEAEARRYRDLKARNFVSASAVEGKETALAAAAAQAGLTRNQTAYARLASDHAGVVAAVLAEPGQVVAAGQAVLRLARDGQREVAIALPESVLDDVRVGRQAEVRLWSGGRTYRGRVRELSPMADAATRTFSARVSLEDADDAVALGMTAAVRFPAAAGEAVSLPLTALFQQGDRPAVWVVVADGTVSLRPVTVAAYTGAGATIADGLRPGERVVAAGVHKLTAGQAVRVAP